MKTQGQTQSGHHAVTVAVCAAAIALLSPARAEDVDLARLRADLVGARRPHEVDRVLDALAERIGQDPGFEDAAAFGDWLGELPEQVASRTRVRLRRGWAYLAAERLDDAVSHLEAVMATEGEHAAVAMGYRGEVARRKRELARAFEYLISAAERGWRDMFLVECARKTAFQMHETRPSNEFEALPEYVEALRGLVGAFDHPLLHGTIARWLLDDYAAYALPGTKRAKAWAGAAAHHALAAAGVPAVSGANARMAFDAAEALLPEDRETKGRTHRLDLLVAAWQIGNRPQEDTHEIPQVVALLAEAALRAGEFELAHRLARQRLSISDSPLARRVLDALPPDIGD